MAVTIGMLAIPSTISTVEELGADMLETVMSMIPADRPWSATDWPLSAMCAPPVQRSF